ncbi:MAG TPA: DUF2971 domain-containing protein [Solidesulfovibrio magneticus]|nr:DUF2971 domain-containing protein [Solidesulfovibrio magneticus]
MKLKSLFKFMKPQRASRFFEGNTPYLNFAAIHTLNDPFEFTISSSLYDAQVDPQEVSRIQKNPEMMMRDIQELLVKETGRESNVDFLSGDKNLHLCGKDKISRLDNAVEEAIKNKRIGVLSMSGAVSDEDEINLLSNPLMWAHYCEYYEGFAVKLDPEHPFFKDNSTQRLSQVKYVEKIPSYSPECTSEDGLLSHVGVVKSQHWEYEKEWRLIAECFENFLYEDEAMLKQLPIDAIQGIYIGLNCKNYKNSAIGFGYKNRIPVYMSSKKNNTWGLEFVKIA